MGTGDVDQQRRGLQVRLAKCVALTDSSFLPSQHVATATKGRAGDSIRRLDSFLERRPWVYTIQASKDLHPVRLPSELLEDLVVTSAVAKLP